jgi:hypothetical protein
MKTTALFSLAAFCTSVSPALAQPADMPPGSTNWIELAAGAMNPGLESDELGWLDAIPLPSPNYMNDTQSYPNGIIYAAGDNSPNRLRSAYWRKSCGNVFHYNSVVDTYTVTGPPGTEGQPIGARLKVRCTGKLFVGPYNFQGGISYLFASYLVLEVGNWNPASQDALEQFRVVPWDETNFVRRTQVGNGGNNGTVMPILDVDLLIDQVLPRTVGTPFDVGVGLTGSGAGMGNTTGAATPPDDGYMVVTIDWELPEGYTMTSLKGWTDPDAPACGTSDFNGDGDVGTDADIESFFACLGGNCCGTCYAGGADFNADGDIGTDADIESFFRVLGGGAC